MAAIRAPLLLHYAELDERVNAGIAAYESALKANGKRYTIYMYPGVNHAFNNDTGGARYNKEAAVSHGSGQEHARRSHLAREPAYPANDVDFVAAGRSAPRFAGRGLAGTRPAGSPHTASPAVAP